MTTHKYVLPQETKSPIDRLRVRLAYAASARYSEEWSSAPHSHACAELFFITGGLGRFRVRQEEFPAAPYDLVAVNGNVPHAALSQTDNPMEYIVLGVEGLEAAAGPSGCALLHLGAEREELMNDLRRLLREAQQDLPGWDAVCQNLLENILLQLLRREEFSLSGGPAFPGPKGNRECGMVRRYIDSHFRENLTLDQLAALAHINKYYLAHVFRREFGVSPINYLISRRIQESCALLRDTDHTLSQIAHILGFSSQSYFSQCFRRVEGISPLEYRRRSRQGGAGPDPTAS